jgi:hypothetical protein
MRRLLPALLCLLASLPAQAWNAAGHRLVAVIAWQQLSPAARSDRQPGPPPGPCPLARQGPLVRPAPVRRSRDLAGRHPQRSALLRRGATATPPLPGLPDTARHKRWHYVDLDTNGRVREGELDSRIEHLIRQLKPAASPNRSPMPCPGCCIWSPTSTSRCMSAGMATKAATGRDRKPFNKRLPFTSLHLYWDDLPGPPWLRGKRLEDSARRLLERYPAPEQGNVALWREESHRLLDTAYPTEPGSLLPMVSEAFHRASRDTANRRIVEAGYRLGRLLDSIFGHAVSRGTK